MPAVSRRQILLLTALAVVVRLPFIWALIHQPGFHWTWGGEMAQVAASLARGDEFGSPYGGSTGPTALVPPAYPAYLAGLFVLFGPAHAVLIELGINAMVSALICWPLYIIGERIRPRMGVAAAVLWALAPALIGVTDAAYAWNTSIYLLALMSIVAVAVVRPRAVLTVASLTAAACWIDPAHIPVALACLLVAVWQRWVTPRQAMTMLVVATLILAPWAVRNTLNFHRPMYLRSNGGHELYRGLGVDPADVQTVTRLNPGRDPAELAHYTALGESAYMQEMEARVWAVVRRDPSTVLKRAVIHAMRFWSGTWEMGGPVHRIWFLWPVLVAGAGLIRLWRSGPPFRWFALTVLVVYPLPYYLVPNMSRFRAPIEPLMWLLVAYALTRGGFARASSLST